MPRSHPLSFTQGSTRLGALVVSLVAGLALVASSAVLGQLQPFQPLGAALTQNIKFASPVPYQVFQRDANNRAEVPLVLNESSKDVKITDARINMMMTASPNGPKFVDGKLVGVPVGGPYTINVTIKKEKTTTQATIGPIFVGDLWVLSGQSNMEGVGDLIDVTPPNPQVMCLGMDGKWARAEEPLHWLVDSPDPVHSGDPKDRAARSAQQHKTRTKGAGLGLPFAVALVEQTQVPIGLVPCAHGGTSMEQWNPAKKGEGGKSLYGSMLRQIKLAGGKVKGVLWYQGESDANPEAAKKYGKVFTDFIASVRADLGESDLPFYFVQIGRFVSGGDPKPWNTVQEVQRKLPDCVPNTAVISVIDLELDDAIHVGTQGQKRAGQRLARIAERELFGRVGATTPTFERVSRGPHNTLIVEFKGVNMGPGMGGMRRMDGMAQRGMNNMPMQVQMQIQQMRMMQGMQSPGGPSGVGLGPDRHIMGFSIRKEDGAEIPLIFEAAVGRARDTVVLKLTGPVPPKSFLWYGHGLNPDCNLTDTADMAVPVFGPIALDAIPEFKPPSIATTGPAMRGTVPSHSAAPAPKPHAPAQTSHSQGPIKVLIITGDHGHDWKATTPVLKEILTKDKQISVDVTTTPAKDLTDSNLAKYDVLLLNYKDTPNGPPETKWSDANKAAFLKAVKDEGKGLVVFHFASAAFPKWDEFGKAIAGGWRSQGYHGPKHVYTVKKTAVKHPISDGLPAQFTHTIDELYQNSVMVPGNVVLATAYSDPKKPRGTGKDEPLIWVNHYGKGRVYNNALGHDPEAMSNPNFRAWMLRGVIWAANKGEIGTQTSAAPRVRLLPRAEYLDKMKAGWIGQMAGVAVGAPTEFHHQGEIVPAGEVPHWKPEMINQFNQDDIYVEMTFLRTLEQHGLGASARQAGIDFANSRYPLWHANRAGRDLLRGGIAPPDSGHPAKNKHADDIDYQIEADFSGLIAPGMPGTAVALGEKFGRLMNAGDGLYGGQFVGALYAEAFFERDPVKIVQAGLAAIPSQSQYHECISDVLAWHKQKPDDWEWTWNKVNEKYHKNLAYRRSSCSKNEKVPYKFNIDAKLNGAYIVMGLLYGKGDPDRTITIATRCGQDSDCNPSSAAGVLFTTIGYAKLPQRFVKALDTTRKFNSTSYTFPKLISVCEQLADQAVVQAGGRIDKSADGTQTYIIPVQQVKPSAYAPCWAPGPLAGSRFTPEEMKQIKPEGK
ncbi:MAG: sialate O-acetylesterase [Isosphaeraceae bacterium]